MIKRILLYLIPAVLIYYGSDKLGNIFNIQQERNRAFEITAYLIGIIVSTVAIPISNEKRKKTVDEQAKLIGF